MTNNAKYAAQVELFDEPDCVVADQMAECAAKRFFPIGHGPKELRTDLILRTGPLDRLTAHDLHTVQKFTAVEDKPKSPYGADIQRLVGLQETAIRTEIDDVGLEVAAKQDHPVRRSRIVRP